MESKMADIALEWLLISIFHIRVVILVSTPQFGGSIYQL